MAEESHKKDHEGTQLQWGKPVSQIPHSDSNILPNSFYANKKPEAAGNEQRYYNNFELHEVIGNANNSKLKTLSLKLKSLSPEQARIIARSFSGDHIKLDELEEIDLQTTKELFSTKVKRISLSSLKIKRGFHKIATEIAKYEENGGELECSKDVRIIIESRAGFSTAMESTPTESPKEKPKEEPAKKEPIVVGNPELPEDTDTPQSGDTIPLSRSEISETSPGVGAISTEDQKDPWGPDSWPDLGSIPSQEPETTLPKSTPDLWSPVPTAPEAVHSSIEPQPEDAAADGIITTPQAAPASFNEEPPAQPSHKNDRSTPVPTLPKRPVEETLEPMPPINPDAKPVNFDLHPKHVSDSEIPKVGLEPPAPLEDPFAGSDPFAPGADLPERKFAPWPDTELPQFEQSGDTAIIAPVEPHPVTGGSTATIENFTEEEPEIKHPFDKLPEKSEEQIIRDFIYDFNSQYNNYSQRLEIKDFSHIIVHEGKVTGIANTVHQRDGFKTREIKIAIVDNQPVTKHKNISNIENIEKFSEVLYFDESDPDGTFELATDTSSDLKYVYYKGYKIYHHGDSWGHTANFDNYTIERRGDGKPLYMDELYRAQLAQEVLRELDSDQNITDIDLCRAVSRKDKTGGRFDTQDLFHYGLDGVSTFRQTIELTQVENLPYLLQSNPSEDGAIHYKLPYLYDQDDWSRLYKENSDGTIDISAYNELNSDLLEAASSFARDSKIHIDVHVPIAILPVIIILNEQKSEDFITVQNQEDLEEVKAKMKASAKIEMVKNPDVIKVYPGFLAETVEESFGDGQKGKVNFELIGANPRYLLEVEELKKSNTTVNVLDSNDLVDTQKLHDEKLDAGLKLVKRNPIKSAIAATALAIGIAMGGVTMWKKSEAPQDKPAATAKDTDTDGVNLDDAEDTNSPKEYPSGFKLDLKDKAQVKKAKAQGILKEDNSIAEGWSWEKDNDPKASNGILVKD